MAWYKGTIIDANPGAAISTQLKALVGGSGVANWSFVENVPAGTGAGQSGSSSYSVDVFKCSGSGTDANSAGQDWYLALQIYPATAALSTLAFRLYKSIAAYPADADRGKCASPLGGHISSTPHTPDPTTWGFDYTAGVPNYRTFAARWSGSPLSVGYGYIQTLNTSGFTLALKLTNSGISVSTYVGTSPSIIMYCLLESTIIGITDEFPLWGSTGGSANMSGLNTQQPYPRGCFATLPGVTAANISAANLPYYNSLWNTANYPWFYAPINAGATAANTSDLWLGRKNPASPIGVWHRTANGGTSQSLVPYYTGSLRGLIPADWLGVPVQSCNLFDTTTLDGNSDWTCVANDWYITGASYVTLFTRAV